MFLNTALTSPAHLPPGNKICGGHLSGQLSVQCTLADRSGHEAVQTCDLQGAVWKAGTAALSPDTPQGNLSKWQQSLELSLNLNSLPLDQIAPLCSIPSP